ncbi:MAG: hypothetical protein WBW11_21705, partial [Pseudolabrys sp.]
AALTKVKDLLDWLPDPLVAVMILGIAVLVALALASLGTQARASGPGRTLPLISIRHSIRRAD